jgi:hypothetical protein
MADMENHPSWRTIRVDDFMAAEWERQADLLPPSKSDLAEIYREHAKALRSSSSTKMLRVEE